MTTDQKPKELSPLAKQLLANWQGLGENVGIGSAGTDRAEIGGRPLAEVAEDFAQRLRSQGVTDLSKAQFTPGQQAAWTAEGHGNVSLVATKDGRLVPVWGSSSDAGKARQVALALGSAWLAPGLAGALGGGLTGSAGAGALLGAGRAAITGGDILKGALTGGLTGGAGYGVSTFVDPFAADIGKSVSEVAGKTVGEAAKGAISGAARSAVGAGLTGGNIGDALLSGAIGGGTNAAIGDTLSGLPKEIRGPVTAAVSAGLLGKDPTQAAIMSYAGSLLKGVPSPFGKSGISAAAASAGYGGADPGFFDPDAETAPLPDWALDPYKTNTPAFTPSSDDAYEDIESLLTRYTDQGFADTPTGDLSQSIDVTGTREKDIPDWDVLPDLVTTPRSIRDVGPVTQIQPGEKLEGTTIKEPDLSSGLTTVTGGTTKTTTAKKPSQTKEEEFRQLMSVLALMQGKSPQEEKYQLANIQPLGYELMYGLRG